MGNNGSCVLHCSQQLQENEPFMSKQKLLTRIRVRSICMNIQINFGFCIICDALKHMHSLHSMRRSSCIAFLRISAVSSLALLFLLPSFYQRGRLMTFYEKF